MPSAPLPEPMPTMNCRVANEESGTGSLIGAATVTFFALLAVTQV